MGRAGITYTEVARAADELIEAAITPTIEKIRTKIGSGSYTTIGHHLKTWKSKCPSEQLAHAEKLPIPLITSVKQLWEQLKQNATLISDDIQTKADQAIAHEQEARVVAEKQAHTLQQHTQALETQLNDYHDVITDLQTQRQQSLDQNKEQTHLIASLNAQIESKQHDNNKLHQLTQTLHKNLEHFQKTTAEQRQQEKLDFHEQKTKYEHQIKQLITNLNRTQQALEQHAYEKNQFAEQVKICQQQLRDQHTTLLTCQSDNEALRCQLNTTRADLQSVQATLKNEQAHYRHLTKRYDVLLKSNIKLKLDNSKLTQTKLAKPANKKKSKIKTTA